MILLRNLFVKLKTNSSYGLISVALITSSLILAALLYFADTTLLLESLKQFDLKVIPLILLIFFVLFVIVGLRLFISLRLSGFHNFIRSFDAGILHITLLNFLPVRLGDILYPFILKSSLQVITARSIANLIIIRIYDYVSVIIILLFSGWIYFVNTSVKLDFQYLLLAGIPVIMAVILAIRLFIILALRVTSKKPIHLFSKNVHEFIVELNDGFTILGIHQHLLLLIMTFLRWFFASILFLMIFKGTGLTINFNEAVLVTTGVNLSVILPIQTIGGFGLSETVMAYFLGIFGNPFGTAIAIAISTRIIWLLGLFSLSLLWILSRTKVLKFVDIAESHNSSTIQ